MYDEYPVIKYVLLNGQTVNDYAIHKEFLNDFWMRLSAGVYAGKVPHYALPNFMDDFKDDPVIETLSKYILKNIGDVDQPFYISYKELGPDYIMSLHLQPKPANLCRRMIEPLQPNDKWVILSLGDISDYFVTTTVGIPSFINLKHEEVLVWIMRNLGTSSAHMEFILNTLQTKVLDDFNVNAYPYDDAVLDLLTSSFGAVLLMLIELFQRFNLFDAQGRNFWHVSEINKYEVILYDSRRRAGLM